MPKLRKTNTTEEGIEAAKHETACQEAEADA
jgi:hypothetical protein